MDFACIDPDAACVNDDLVIENCGDLLGIGDGYCDRENNSDECGKSRISLIMLVQAFFSIEFSLISLFFYVHLNC